MKRSRLIILIVSLTLGGSLLFGLGMRKNITLMIDGERRSLTTYMPTVGGLLRTAQVPITPDDYLQPPVDHWLKDGETITLVRAVQVVILSDGEIHYLVSTERQAEKLLEQAGIPLHPGDLLLAEGYPVPPDKELHPSSGVIELQINRAVSFTVSEGSQEYTYSSAASSLGQALWEAGIILFAADRLTPGLDTPLTPDLHVSLQRAHTITIQTQADTLSLLTAAETVGEALAEAGLAPQNLDYSLPAADAPLPRDGIIRLVRVHEDVIIEQTPLPFENTYQPDPDLEIDNQTIIQTGEYGLTAKRVRVRYEDGQEISRHVEDEWVARQPQPRIVGFGTNIVMHTTDSQDGPIQYWRALTMWATSYHPGATGSDRTATGDTLRKGIVATNPTYIPYGTRLYIPGYGFAVAADTGNLGPRSIDLGYSDEDFVPWHQNVTIYFLWPPPENVVWVFP